MPRNEDRNEVRKKPEYIEREALIEEINSLQVSVTGLRVGKSVLGEYIKHYKDSIIKIINEQPDADVAEVVRCIECRNLEFVKTSRGSAWRCRRNMVTEPYIHPDCYCYYGEKQIRSEQE